jgi:hypothetical protein
MRLSPSCLATMAMALITGAAAVGPTDSYTDADVMQSGYLPNHNMDPAVVDSAQFGQLWKKPFNAKEQVSLPGPVRPLLFPVSLKARQACGWKMCVQALPRGFVS